MGIPPKLILAFAALNLFSSPIDAEEAAQPLLTALSATTISGYPDVGEHWNPGTGNYVPLSSLYRTEILWKHQDGRLALWIMSGTDLIGSYRYFPADPLFPTPLQPVAYKQGNVYSEQGDQILRGNSFIVSQSFPSRDLPFAGVAQMVGSGEPDLIWASGSQIVAWEMSGDRMVRQHNVYVRSYVPADARVFGIGRFDANASMDLAWHDPQGNLWISLMDGMQIRETVRLNNGRPVNPNWMPRATGDFNFDGKTDLLWLNKDGRTAVWFMDGTTKIGSALLRGGRPVGPGWDIVDTEQIFLFWGDNVSRTIPIRTIRVGAGGSDVDLRDLRNLITNSFPVLVPAPTVPTLPAIP